MAGAFSTLASALFSMHPLQLDPAAFGVDASLGDLSPNSSGSKLDLKIHFNLKATNPSGSATSMSSANIKSLLATRLSSSGLVSLGGVGAATWSSTPAIDHDDAASCYTDSEDEDELMGSARPFRSAVKSRMRGTKRAGFTIDDDDDDDSSDDESVGASSHHSRADSATSDLSASHIMEKLRRLKEQEALAEALPPVEATENELEDPRGPPPAYQSPPNSRSSRTQSEDNLSSTSSKSKASRFGFAGSLLPSIDFSHLAGEVGFAMGYGFHQVKVVSSGLFTLLSSGSSRPNWPAHVHMITHFLRTQLEYKGHSLSRARMADRNAQIDLAPSGCKVTTVEMHVARRELLKFEAEALRFHKRFPAPIPGEIDEHGEPVYYSDYRLDGEWVDGTDLPGYQDKSTFGVGKWFGWFWGRPQEQLGWRASGFGKKRGKSKKVILMLHGGAYCVGNTMVYRYLTSRISAETGCRLFAVNYRLAPEYPFPAALHDAFAAYLYLVNPHHPAFQSIETGERFPVLHEPIAPEDIILVGDSAGGGLCMALLNYLKDYLRWPNGSPMLPLPGGAILICPWLDLTFGSQSWRDNAQYDWLPASTRNLHEPLVPATDGNEGIPHPVWMYVFGSNPSRQLPLPTTYGVGIFPTSPSSTHPPLLPTDCTCAGSTPTHGISQTSSVSGSWAGRSWRETLLLSATDRERFRLRDALERMARHPLVSPVFAEDLAGLPPILIQAGDCEVLRDETIALAYRYHASCMRHRRKSSVPNAFTAPLPQRRARGFVRHEMYADMVHVFHAFAWLPQARLALKNMRRFVCELEDAECAEATVDWEVGRFPTKGYPDHHEPLAEEEAKMVSLNEHLKLL
ncbi:hypothetical protein HDU96_006583 [Phlyctochytrium bullatum]|nr:hypothetical protein HDU96_006583 [Phlyctochytrium bullatum]